MPLPTKKKVIDKDTKAETIEDVKLKNDEGNRPDTTMDGLAGLKPVREGAYITAGNASQLSDGASACVVMERKRREEGPQAARHLPRLRGRRCEPDEMGIGPVFAVPKLLHALA